MGNETERVERRNHGRVGLTRVLSAALIIAGGAAIGGALGANARLREPIIAVKEPRIVILKSKRWLHLLDGDRLVRVYPIDLGVSPVGTKRRKDDGRTPLGTFRIVTKNTESPYHRFLGIDYPDEGTVEWGLARGLISHGEAASLRGALAAGRCPDWGTALGGGIGIHGRRVGRDWTGGCVALSDQDVEELHSVLRIGDPVEILP